MIKDIKKGELYYFYDGGRSRGTITIMRYNGIIDAREDGYGPLIPHYNFTYIFSENNYFNNRYTMGVNGTFIKCDQKSPFSGLFKLNKNKLNNLFKNKHEFIITFFKNL